MMDVVNCEGWSNEAGKETPSSFVPWLPFLWSRVLFPGRSEVGQHRTKSHWLVLLLVPGVLLYPAMSFLLFEPDEGRYAQIACEMLQSGDWIVPTLQGRPYLDKPPLVYWLIVANYWLFGISEWSARLVPALSVHATILLTYFFGRRLLGNRPALLGALVLTLTPGFMGMGRLLLLDGVLAFWVTLSLFAAFEATRGDRFGRGWWLLSALACGLGVLTKGPVALLLLVPPLWLHGRLTLQNNRPGWRASSLFVAIVLAVALPWYLAVCLELPQFGSYFFVQHNFERFVIPFDHERPIWFYAPVLFAGLLPASLLLVPFLRFLGTGRPDVASCRSPELGFTLLAGCWCVLFFSLSGSKLPTYILPAIPFLSLALGCFLVHDGWSRLAVVRIGAAASFVVLATASWLIVPRVAWLRSPMKESDLVWEYCQDTEVPVVCYPRPVDSVAFYVGRRDFRSFRSKQTPALLQFLLSQPKTVVLFSHRHSLKQLREVLPPQLVLSESGPLGLCDMAVIQRVDQNPITPRPNHRSAVSRSPASSSTGIVSTSVAGAAR